MSVPARTSGRGKDASQYDLVPPVEGRWYLSGQLAAAAFPFTRRDSAANDLRGHGPTDEANVFFFSMTAVFLCQTG